MEIKTDLNFSTLVNPKEIIDEPVNRWFSLKESYSGFLVEKILSRYNKKDIRKTLDPFLGTGSTLFKAWELGIKGFGFDVNPLAILVSKVKTRNYNHEDINNLRNKINIMLNLEIIENEYPAWNPIDKYIEKEILNKLLTYRTFIEQINNNKIKNLIKLIWISVIEEVSYFRKTGNGIKYSKKEIKHSDINNLINNKFLTIKNDIEYYINKNQTKGEIKIYQDSSMNINNYKNINKIDAVITSPPYANCFDYFEVYKVELWMANYINSYEEWRKYKKKSMRNNLNAKLIKNHILDNSYLIDIIKKIEKKVELEEIKDKRIPIMLNNYFYDMEVLLRELKTKLNNGAIVSIVVGNSAYGGVVVTTDKIIANIGQKLDYKLIEIIKTRKLRSSPQQMKKMSINEEMKLRESIVTFRNE